MTNHPKFTESHDSAARSVGYEGARESRLRCECGHYLEPHGTDQCYGMLLEHPGHCPCAGFKLVPQYQGPRRDRAYFDDGSDYKGTGYYFCPQVVENRVNIVVDIAKPLRHTWEGSN